MSLAELSAMLNASKSSGGAANLNLGGGGGGGRGPSSGSSGAPGSAASPAALKQHADHMWRFLDDLAASDPEGYKKFMATQMQEMAAEKAKAAETEAMFTPQPVFVIYTRQTAGKGGERTIYLNLCTSPQIPPLQTKDQKGPADPLESNMSEILIPLSVGAIKADQDRSKGEVWTADVVFNPAVMARAVARGDMAFKLFMIELALQHLEQDEKCSLHRAYKMIPLTEATYIGGGAAGRPAQQKTEAELAREKFLAQMQADRAEKIKNMQTKSSKDIVMPSISKTQQAKQEYEEQSIKELKLRPEAAATAAAAGGKDGAGAKAQPKRVLIEDLTPDQGEDPSLTADVPAPRAAPAAKSNAPSAASASSSAVAAAKPAISLASSTKLSSAASSSASASSSSSTSAAAAAPAASVSSAAASSSSSSSAAKSSSSVAPEDGAWSSKMSSAISSADFLSSLAAIPLEDSPSPWPYGSSAASMSSTSSAATVSAVKAAQRVQPVHSLSVSPAGQLDLAIQLPLVNSVGELELDVSRTQLQLTSDHYALTITFPGHIFEERSAAKFVKKQRTLKISAPMR